MPKAKERYQAIKDRIESEKESQEVELVNRIYDIKKINHQNYEIVELRYDQDVTVAKCKIVEKNIFSLARAQVMRDNMNVQAYLEKEKKGLI